MKAFLLAAGQGTRLRPLTDRIPKCLVPIGGVSMLEIWLELCRRSGIDDILINVHSHASLIYDAVRTSTDGLKISVVQERVLLGSAGTLWANRVWVAGESCFWVLYADVLTNANLTDMLSCHRDSQAATTIGLYQVKDPERRGVVSVDANLIVREFVEKPQYPKSNWAFAGIMITHPKVLDKIPPRVPADLGFDLLPQLSGQMQGFPMRDYLLDIGTIENYELAQRTWSGL